MLFGGSGEGCGGAFLVFSASRAADLVVIMLFKGAALGTSVGALRGGGPSGKGVPFGVVDRWREDAARAPGAFALLGKTGNCASSTAEVCFGVEPCKESPPAYVATSTCGIAVVLAAFGGAVIGTCAREGFSYSTCA